MQTVVSGGGLRRETTECSAGGSEIAEVVGDNVEGVLGSMATLVLKCLPMLHMLSYLIMYRPTSLT